MTEFPKKLRQLRKEMEMNQTELAEAIGVTQRSLTNYERGIAIPRQSTMRKLANVLGVTVEYLTNDDADDPDASRAIEEKLNEVQEQYGNKYVKEMKELVDQNVAFLAGGTVDQETKDAFFEALMSAYLTCKEEARRKFTPKSANK